MLYQTLDFSGYGRNVQFGVNIKHGQGTREVRIEVPATEIVKLGAHLSRFDLSEGIGHPMYHYQFPDRGAVPCSMCRLKKPDDGVEGAKPEAV